MMSEFEEDLARLAAAADQAKNALKEVAHMLGIFREELMSAGFERGEALGMCIVQLQCILSQRGDD